MASPSWRERARKGGVKSYLVSLEAGCLSMKERGQRGGRPRALTVEELKKGGKYRARPEDKPGVCPRGTIISASAPHGKPTERR